MILYARSRRIRLWHHGSQQDVTLDEQIMIGPVWWSRGDWFSGWFVSSSTGARAGARDETSALMESARTCSTPTWWIDQQEQGVNGLRICSDETTPPTRQRCRACRRPACSGQRWSGRYMVQIRVMLVSTGLQVRTEASGASATIQGRLTVHVSTTALLDKRLGYEQVWHSSGLSTRTRVHMYSGCKHSLILALTNNNTDIF
jgi:hypothetical protein